MRQLLFALTCTAGLAVGLFACGGNSSPGGLDASTAAGPDAGGNPDDPTACSATCLCKDQNCACASGADCTINCSADLGAKCNISCSGTSKCTVDGYDDTNLACNDGSECTGTTRDGADVTCSNTSKCTLSVKAGSNLTCTNDANCKVTVGGGTNVVCSLNATCDLTGTLNDQYTVVCSDSAKCLCRDNCAMTCGVTGLPTTCGDGSKVCNQACP